MVHSVRVRPRNSRRSSKAIRNFAQNSVIIANFTLSSRRVSPTHPANGATFFLLPATSTRSNSPALVPIGIAAVALGAAAIAAFFFLEQSDPHGPESLVSVPAAAVANPGDPRGVNANATSPPASRSSLPKTPTEPNATPEQRYQKMLVATIEPGSQKRPPQKSVPVVAAAPVADGVSFSRDIRPILSEHCFHCHGPDPESRKADLRLDTEEGAFADLGGYLAFDPEDPAASEALARMITDDEDELMPPPEMHKPLSEAQIALIRRWVEEGAEWEGHWAFTPLVAPTPPEPPSRAEETPVRNPDRRLHPERPGTGRTRALARGRPCHPDPPAQPRPHRAAAEPGGDRDLSLCLAKRSRRRLRSRRRSPARLAALRRAPRPLLARCRPLRRHPWLPPRQLPLDLAVSRLGDQRLQCQHALRPIHHRAARR